MLFLGEAITSEQNLFVQWSSWSKVPSLEKDEKRDSHIYSILGWGSAY